VILITDNIGQLGNQIVRFAHFIAFAERFGVRVGHAYFDEYARYFPAFDGDPLARYPRPRRALPRVTQLAARAARELGERLPDRDEGPIAVVRVGPEEFDLGDRRFVKLAHSARVVLAHGFLFRDYDSWATNADLLRRVFTPHRRHLEAARSCAAEARGDSDLLIGIHIRRGNYETWNEGRYFWTDEQYQNLMTRAAASYAGRRVRFLVCSNDSWALDPLAEQITPGPGHEVEDMYALAHCDAIVGPPSTYTLWGSFWGQTPLWSVSDVAEEPNFRVALPRG
jgi:hypothetical protein